MKIKILKEDEHSECKEGEIMITDCDGEGGDCEHCGKLPPFSASVCDGGTRYCLSCNACDDDMKLTKAQVKEIEAECLNREKAYIKMRYEELFGKKK